jgi:predicted Rossmann fold flavoprotein
MFHVAILGAGAAGLWAALAAARSGTPTLMLESMDRPGRKFALTGHGRGNISHELSREAFLVRFGPAAAFLKPALYACDLPKLKALLAEHGVSTITQADGRIFPATTNASGLVTILTEAVRRAGVHLVCGAQVQAIIRQDKGFALEVGAQRWQCRAIVLATGGMSYPSTGSRGDGLRMAQALGHHITDPVPGLVALHAPGTAPAQGSSLKAKVGILVEGRCVARTSGPVLMTHTGFSGPAILDLSKYATAALAQGKNVAVQLQLVETADAHQADRLLLQTIAHGPRRSLATILETWLPPKASRWLAGICGLDPHQQAHNLPARERKTLAHALAGLCLPITGHGGWEQAMITCGGVSRREVHARTLMSRIVPGLFFAGEVLDMDGPTGGFNLHAAMATGALAGACAARWAQEQPL